MADAFSRAPMDIPTRDDQIAEETVETYVNMVRASKEADNHDMIIDDLSRIA